MGKASRRKRRKRAAVENALARAQRSHSIVRELPRVRNYKGPATSAVLHELIEPYMGEDRGVEQHRKLVTLGVMAWNWAVEPESFSRERIEDIFRQAGLPSDGFDDAYEALDELRRRKLRLFPKDRRLILDTAVREQDGGYYVTATAVVREVSAGFLGARHALGD